MKQLNQHLKDKGHAPREIETINYVMNGLSNIDISNNMGIKEKTVKYYLTNIFKRLKIKSRIQLVVYCIPYVYIKRSDIQVFEKNDIISGTQKLL